jgi:hypothetical protein
MRSVPVSACGSKVILTSLAKEQTLAVSERYGVRLLLVDRESATIQADVETTFLIARWVESDVSDSHPSMLHQDNIAAESS